MAGSWFVGLKRLSLHLWCPDGGTQSCAMGIGRTVLAVIIAFSVVFLPIAESAGHSVLLEVMDMSVSGDMSVSQHMSVSKYMSVSRHIPDCCPREAAPCDKAKSMAPCGSVCCSFVVPALSAPQFSLVLAETIPTLVSQVFRSQSSSPPFRPPSA